LFFEQLIESNDVLHKLILGIFQLRLDVGEAKFLHEMENVEKRTDQNLKENLSNHEFKANMDEDGIPHEVIKNHQL
jgi:hypothetical protein